MALVAAALVLAAGCSSSGHPSSSPPSSTTEAPGTTETPSTSTAAPTTNVPASTEAPAAHAFVHISPTPTVTGKSLSLAVVLDGQVPQLYEADGGPPISGTQQDLNTRVDFGDGTAPGGTDGGFVACRAGAPLVPIHMSWMDVPPSFAFDHDYARPGAYTVTFTVRVCGLGDVKKRIAVTIA